MRTFSWLDLCSSIGPFLVIMLLGSMLPAIDFDVLEYHLQGPKEYYQAGRIAFLPHNVYTNMPFGVEMLHLAGMEVMGDWWWGGLVGQFLVAALCPRGRGADRRRGEAIAAPGPRPGSRPSSTCRRPGSTAWPSSPTWRGRSASITPP